MGTLLKDYICQILDRKDPGDCLSHRLTAILHRPQINGIFTSRIIWEKLIEPSIPQMSLRNAVVILAVALASQTSTSSQKSSQSLGSQDVIHLSQLTLVQLHSSAFPHEWLTGPPSEVKTIANPTLLFQARWQLNFQTNTSFIYLTINILKE